MDEPLAVEAVVDARGGVQPKAFVWEGKRHTVRDVGRRWMADDWEHLLVLTADGRTWELAHSAAQGAWRLCGQGWLPHADRV